MVAAVAAGALEERLASGSIWKDGCVSDTLLEGTLVLGAVVARLCGDCACCIDNGSLGLIRMFHFLDDWLVCDVEFELARPKGLQTLVLFSKTRSPDWISPCVISVVFKGFDHIICGMVCHGAFKLSKAYSLDRFIVEVHSWHAWHAHGGCLDVRKHFELVEPNTDEEMTMWR